MTLDHDAIMKAYKGTIWYVDDDTGVWDKDGNQITVDQTLVDAARVELDNEAAASAYQRSRTGEDGETDTIYLPIQEQLDLMYWDQINGTTNWKDHITAVKAKYPKPS